MQDKGRSLMPLCRYLLPSDLSLVDEVARAQTDPGWYASHYQVTEPTPDHWRAWYALLHGLSTRGRLRSIDWREAPEYVMEDLDDLLRNRLPDADHWSWVDIAHWEERPTDEFLNAIAKWLLGLGLSLVYLDADADSYPLIVVGSQDYPHLKDLATQAGYGGAWVSLMADTAD